MIEKQLRTYCVNALKRTTTPQWQTVETDGKVLRSLGTCLFSALYSAMYMSIYMSPSLYLRGGFGFIPHLERVVTRLLLATLATASSWSVTVARVVVGSRVGVRRCQDRVAHAAVASAARVLGELHPVGAVSTTISLWSPPVRSRLPMLLLLLLMLLLFAAMTAVQRDDTHWHTRRRRYVFRYKYVYVE